MTAPNWIPNGVGGWPLTGGVHTRVLGFVKTALLRQLVRSDSLVCDLYCGRGLDIERWAEAGIGRYVGVASALQEAREQWGKHGKPFPAEFCELDPCMVDLEAHLQEQGCPADIVCCLAHLQDSFTSEDMVRRLLKNVAAVLKPGGFFFGTAPDSSTIWYKYQKAVEMAIKAGSLRVNGTLPPVRTEIYKISFDDDRFHTFGSKYHIRFTDEGLPAQPQLLVHFPSLIRLAKEVGLECVEIQNLLEFYDDYSGPFGDVLKRCCGSSVDLKGAPLLDAKGRLTHPALDVLSLYTSFIFKKVDPTMPNFHFLPTLEQASEASSLGDKNMIHLPPHFEVLSCSMTDEPVREGQQLIVIDNHGPSDLSLATLTNSQRNYHPRQDSNTHNNGSHAVGPMEELSHSGVYCGVWQTQMEGLSELTVETDIGQRNRDNILDNHNEGQRDELAHDPRKKNCQQSNRRSSQMNIMQEDGTFLNKGFRVSSSAEKGDAHRPISVSRGLRTSRGSSRSGQPSLTEPGRSRLMEVVKLEELSRTHAEHNSNHYLQRTGESIDQSSRGNNRHESPPGDQSPIHSAQKTSGSTDENKRGSMKRTLPVGDHISKNYTGRTYDGREESNHHEREQELPHRELTARYYLRKSQESLEQEPAQADISSVHCEQSTHGNMEESDRNVKHHDLKHADRSSRHYRQGSSDGCEESNRSEQSHQEKGRDQSGRFTWGVRPGPQEEFHHVFGSSHPCRSTSQIPVKRSFSNPTNSLSTTPRGNKDAMPPSHSGN